MMEIFRTDDNAKQNIEIEEIEKGCWICLTSPTAEEINRVKNTLDIESNFLYDPLDEEEKPRIDIEDDQELIIVDIPYVYEDENTLKFETLPLGLIIYQDEYLITICREETPVIKRFREGKIKNIVTYKKTRLILQMLYHVAKDYLRLLRHIDKKTDLLEETLHKSMRNKELFKLLEFQKSLVFFTTSLKANEVVHDKLLKGKAIKLYEEDEDLLEDVIIENKQAIEMSGIYSSIINSMMDSYSSVISNNLNIVMKILTSVTIILTIPTMIFSFYGINVPLPFENNAYGYLYILGGSMVFTILSVYLLWKKKMF